VLLEGDVGVGKTTVLRAFARAVGGDFERVEGTVDLMPNDLVYHTYVDSDGKPRIEPGPLLRHGERLTTFFFNEINRADRRCSRCCCVQWRNARCRRSTASTAFRT
jgi:MoxR-like ATPase